MRAVSMATRQSPSTDSMLADLAGGSREGGRRCLASVFSVSLFLTLQSPICVCYDDGFAHQHDLFPTLNKENLM